jgi:peptidoglycan/xylan/chitin deacetylase (PgdA/CDA1 family)
MLSSVDNSAYILNFHGLGRPPHAISESEARCWVSESVFESILEVVREKPRVQLTFDDGNLSDITVALPALLQRGMKAKFFVVADRIAQPGYLSRDDVRVLRSSGMTLGTHGMRHRMWRGLKAGELDEELREARSRLEEIQGAPIVEAACPFGSYDRRVLRELRRLGYERVYTSDGGHSNPTALVQARNTVLRHHDHEQIQRAINPRHHMSSFWRAIKSQIKRWR